MQTDFNYREDHSSGAELNHREKEEEKKSNSNHWLRQSKIGGLDIDDIPIPTNGEGPKTFEELLEEKMEAAEALNSQNNMPQEVPKK